MQILISILIILLGASFGSFVNLFIYRRENSIDFVLRPSFCENCNKKIKKLDLIPIFSYIFLRGRCRYCKNKIRVSVFIFEILSAVLFLFSFCKYRISLNFVITSFELLMLLAIGYVDFKTEYIYRMDVVILFILEFVFKIYNKLNFLNALIGAGCVFIIIFLIIIITNAMGYGDLELFFVVGFISSLEEILFIFTLIFSFAAVASIILIILKKKTKKDYIALGPYISLGTMLMIFLRWIMKKVNLIIEDGYILYKTKEQVKREYICLDIFKNGRIIDYHHFFYRLKKILEKEDKKFEYEIFLSSTEIIHINYMIPKVEEEDLDEFINLELKDYIDYDVSQYKIKYKKLETGSEIKLSIDLIPKEIINSFINIFEKYNLKLKDVYPKSYLISENKKYIYLNLNSYELIDNVEFLVKTNKKNYSSSLEEIILRNNLEGYNIKNILEDKYDSAKINLEDDFINMYIVKFYEKLSEVLEFANENNIIITGILADSKLKSIFDRKNISYEIQLEEELLNITETKKYEISKNYKKFIPLLFLIIIFLINMLYNNNLNDNLVRIKDNKKDIVINKKENFTSDNEQEYNKLFLKNMKNIESLESEDILFTEFIYSGHYFKVKGVSKDKDSLKILEKFKILKEEGYIEDGMYKFSLDIENN